MTARVVLLVTSPRLPVGLLTAAAWDVVRGNPVLAGAESGLTAAVRAAGAEVTVPDGPPVPALLHAAAAHGAVVWLAGPAGDESLARELGLRLAREPGLAELELMYGSWDPPGARLLDAVEVMDRLASPGGDPWKRAQTHRSLAGYLIEECYEAYDAIGADDTDSLREELGDVLLQVLLHARMAEELPDGARWTVDDVAGGLVDKMIRRNPHVFADDRATMLDEITANWERIKRAEKARDSVLDGIAPSLPALALAAKILDRAGRAGLTVPLPTVDAQPAPAAVDAPPAPAGGARVDPSAGVEPRVDPEARLGAELLAAVAAARAADLDPEAALRRTTLAYADAVRAAERTTPRRP
ncbi:nucleoside triphosphate pyrophosphohydrolase [Micromonospora carbonacea]|uniref:Nucleoside triphosphate pyrophosphohydrolase n=1 Tax=Micromonospora carbonacea TaxID=47853 RepID=A0A7H8XH44_9ACTN|nr:nucleoside triphosphate pyrophosphohydrolase [Micromonospora carbonacea]MBB5828736.1 XTP/dITP diphosphohydrolase [Micromonospora carbonacea]QLD23699.1 nucleoside triphosphate pyrophosphohydrolase [Micromonospora carbonacea]